MKTAIYFHAGCPVCQSVEVSLINAIDPKLYQVEQVHLGKQPQRIVEAEGLGVKSVPALVLDQQVLHINFGAALADLK